MTRPERMTRWFMFSVLVSLVPFAISFLTRALGREPIPMVLITADGGLLLTCTAIAAGAFGELIPGGREHPVARLVAGGVCMILILAASFYFAAIKATADPNPAAIFTTSLRVLAGTVLVGAACVYLAHAEVQNADR